MNQSSKILFISYKGSMYRYFQDIKKNIMFDSTVMSFFPFIFFQFGRTDLTQAEIQKGISFELARKKRKYFYIKYLWPFYEAFLSVLFVFYYRRFIYVISKRIPDLICIWNGHRLPEYAIKLIAKKNNIKLAFFENGLLPDSTTVDPKGVNDLNSVPREKEFYENYVPSGNNLNFEIQQRASMKSKKRYSKSPELYEDLPEKFIYVPFQVNHDSQVLLNSSRVNSMDELFQWLDYSIKKIDDKDLFFVIKEHPSDSKKFKYLRKVNERILFRNFDSKDLIEKSISTLTLNSTVGLESLILGKKLILLGESCFKIDGITKFPESRDQLVECINSIDSWKLDLGQVIKYLDYLNEIYCIQQSWRNPSEQHFKSLEQRFKEIIYS